MFVDLPVPALHRPGMHDVQSLFDVRPVPPIGAVELHLPPEQPEHTERPVVSPYFPSEHVPVHEVAALVIPVVVPNLPFAHPVHAVFEVSPALAPQRPLPHDLH